MKKLFFILLSSIVTTVSYAQLETTEQDIPKLLLTCKDEYGSIRKATAEVFVIDRDGIIKTGKRYLQMNSNGTFPDPIDTHGFSYLGKDCRITKSVTNETDSRGKIVASCTAGNGSQYDRRGVSEVLIRDASAALMVKFVERKDSQGKPMKYGTTFKNPVDCSFYTN